MDGLMPKLNDLYKQGRIAWTEQGGWIGLPKEVLGALATDGFYECLRERATSPSGRCLTEGAWDGVNPHTRSLASVTWTVRRTPEPPMVFIEIDGVSITRPAPTLVER